MNENDAATLQGHVEALSLALTAIITTLPHESAARCAVVLVASLDVEEERHRDANRPAATAHSRKALGRAFVALLEARASGA